MEDNHQAARRAFVQSLAAIASVVMAPAIVTAQSRDSSAQFISRHTQLEDIFKKLNPYPGGDKFEIDENGIEYHERPGGWNFKGAAHGIRRAVRIPYTFEYQEGAAKIKIRDYFLIGFEGGAGY